MSDLIPLDLQFEIIKRVCSDVKYMLQLRSVSKEWKSFIDSSEFIAGYGARHTQPHGFILRYIDSDYKKNYICFDDNDNTPLTQNNEKFVVVSDLIEQLDTQIVIGSSHGLFCICGYANNVVGAKMVVVWNPSIRKSVGIVVPDDDPVKTRTFFAFGVCPVSSDPTVVKISYAKDVSIDKTWHVEIFTLRSKCWNMIPSNNVPRQSIRLHSSTHFSIGGSFFYLSTHVAIDRFIYWVARDDSLPVDDNGIPTVHMLLSFDMISNQFEEVVFPDSLANRLPVNVSKLRESLVVLEFGREIDENGYGLWMMEHGDDGIRSFTKLYIINTHESMIVNLLGNRKSGEFIIETRNDDQELATIDVYEPSSQLISNLGIYGREDSFFMHPYMETLLLLDHSDCCIYSSN